MAWYWSDDAARAAVDAGLVTRSGVAEWIHRPVAFSDDAGLELLEVAERHLGITPAEQAGAA